MQPEFLLHTVLLKGTSNSTQLLYIALEKAGKSTYTYFGDFLKLAASHTTGLLALTNSLTQQQARWSRVKYIDGDG